MNKHVNHGEISYELHKKLGKVVADINIDGLASRIVMDTTGRVSTACWTYNRKKKEFTIKINKELVAELDVDELRLVLEHELLHHFKYQTCNVNHPLMENLVLDVAINKTLYLYSPETMCSLAEKIYLKEQKPVELAKNIPEPIKDMLEAESKKTPMERLLADPVVLACPLLDADQIALISDEKIRNAYKEIWGSRATLQDYNTTIPDPVELLFKLASIIENDTPMNCPFGEDSDEESDGEGEGEGEGSGKSKSKGKKKKQDSKASGDGGSDGDGDEASDESDKDSKSSKGKTPRKRCEIIEEDSEESEGGAGGENEKKEEKDESDSEGSGNKKDEDSDKESDEEKDSDSDKSDDAEDGTDGESDGSGDEEEDEGYSEIEEGVGKLESQIAKKIEAVGKGQTGITVFGSSPAAEINVNELERHLREMNIQKTIEEISFAVIGAAGNEVVSLPYALKPTMSTMVHIACGINDVIPFYWNHKDGCAKPKIATYIDVSGSMRHLSQLVQSIVVRIAEYLPSIVFAFDTEIAPVYTKMFDSATLLGGCTSFNRVFEHIYLSTVERREWLEKIVARHKGKAPKSKNNYYDDEAVMNNCSVMDANMLNSEIMTDEAPVIFIITDGEDNIDKKYLDNFKKLQKELIVLQIVGSEEQAHHSPFLSIAKKIFFAGTNGSLLKVQAGK